MDNVCILIPTCDRHRPVAELTARVIDRSWAPHPPLVFCGSSGGPASRWLALEDDPTDWMGIVRHAIRTLLARGYSQCYLVLDDHPPVFRCAARHLNQTLPQVMEKLDAAYIGLNGWGQGKPRRGQVLGAEHAWVERVAPDFPWKFQLHPALWRLTALGEILDVLVDSLPLERRSAWAFERRAGDVQAAVPERLKASAYRVCGRRLAEHRGMSALTSAERLAARLLTAGAGRMLGDRARTAVDAAVACLRDGYVGPYPLFRSGMLVKGRRNETLVRFLVLHGRWRLVREIVRVTQTMEPVRGSAEAARR